MWKVHARVVIFPGLRIETWGTQQVSESANRVAGTKTGDGVYSGCNRTQENDYLPAFEHHVFVCHNSRPADAPRRSCTTDGKSDLHTQLQQLSKEAGLAGRVRINKSGCLDQCEHGPMVVVYPEAVWYGNVSAADAAAIVEEHLIGGRPVERLRVADECLNTKTCPHRD
jgi:(2Fe-2S) ferredoxin